VNNTFRNKRIKGLLPLFFLLAFGACKKESTDIGLGLVGDDVLENAEKNIFTQAVCRTVADDSIRTDVLSSGLFGIVNDPILGESKASLIIEPRVAETGSGSVGKVADSTKLILKFDIDQVVSGSPYRLLLGEADAEITFDIYKMGEDIPDSTYNSYRPLLGDKIGEYTGGFDFSNKEVVIDEDTFTVTPELILTLDNQLGVDILGLSMIDNTELKKVLKGIVLVPREVVSGTGLITAFETKISASRLVVFHDTTELAIPLGADSKRVNYFETTPSAAVDAQLTGSGHFNTTYVQSLSGTKVKVEFPELNDFIKMGERVVINEAYISFLLEDGSVVEEKFSAPPRLLLYAVDSVSDQTAFFEDLLDFQLGQTLNYGGTYSASSKSYDFRFNRFLQRLVDDYRLREVDNFKGFYLRVPTDSPIVPHRAVLNTDTTQQTIKLSVRYTKLN
jgi:hypothetical protein|tara:strand:- start:4334 stop:5677 length:1344 start_codon:yes stop_codon:yes gene_type:complete